MNSSTGIKILVQPKPGAAHQEVVVDIDWEGVSDEDVKFLAQQLLVHNLQAKIRAGFYQFGIPEAITIRAAWEVHRDVVGIKDYSKIPKSWKSGEDKVKVKVEKMTNIEKLLAQLDPAELVALLK